MNTIISANNFNLYTYSKKSHLPQLANHTNELYGSQVDFSLCDLKYYQDLLVFGFIKENIPPGSKILEIGGGESRILAKLHQSYECWNVDKLEGLGNGLTILQNQNNYNLVRDYIGNFNHDLKNEYFDFIFSISALEHTQPDDEKLFSDILKDINRVLSPNGLSLHCFDLVIQEYHIWTNPFLPYLFDNSMTLNNFIPFQKLYNDNDIFVMTKKAYDKCWRSITQKTYKLFGKPFSYNILWCK